MTESKETCFFEFDLYKRVEGEMAGWEEEGGGGAVIAQRRQGLWILPLYTHSHTHTYSVWGLKSQSNFQAG